jgi:hypothetical protein
VLGHGLSDAVLTRAANGVAEDLRRPRIDAAHLPQGPDLVKTGSLPFGNWQAAERSRSGPTGGRAPESPSVNCPAMLKVSAVGPADEVVDAFVRDLRPAGREAVERARGQILEYPPDLLFPPVDEENRPLRVVTHGRNAERAWPMNAGLQEGTFTSALRVLSRRAEIVDGGGGSFSTWKPEYGRAPLTIMHDVMDRELDLPSDDILIGFAGTGVRKVRISYADGASAELPLGPAGGPGGVRRFSAEVKSRSFKLSAEMKDGKVGNTARRIP